MVTVAEIGGAPRGQGRAAKAVKLTLLRELTPADVSLLASERGVRPLSIAKLRDRHHSLARLLAQGLTNAECSRLTGYDPSRISILKGDPTFQELVSDFQRMENNLLAEFVDRTTTLSLTAVNNLQEMLEDDESPLPASVQLEIAKFAADRTGHAPVAKSVSLNVNVGMGDRIKASRERAARAYIEDQVLIEGEVVLKAGAG